MEVAREDRGFARVQLTGRVKKEGDQLKLLFEKENEMRILEGKRMNVCGQNR